MAVDNGLNVGQESQPKAILSALLRQYVEGRKCLSLQAEAAGRILLVPAYKSFSLIDVSISANVQKTKGVSRSWRYTNDSRVGLASRLLRFFSWWPFSL